MISYDGKLTDFISAKELRQKLGVNPGGHVQVAVDKAVVRYCTPYVPKDEGILEGSPNDHTKFGSGEVVYGEEYARYQYYGEVWGPNFPIVENGVITGWYSPTEKYPTGRELQYNTEHNPQAGSHWFERAMADHSDDVLKEAQDAADRGSYP